MNDPISTLERQQYEKQSESDLKRIVMPDVSKERIFEFALSEAQQAKQMMDSISEYENKLEKSKEALIRNKDNDYSTLVMKDIKLYKNALKRFKESRDNALNNFYEYVDHFRRA